MFIKIGTFPAICYPSILCSDKQFAVEYAFLVSYPNNFCKNFFIPPNICSKNGFIPNKISSATVCNILNDYSLNWRGGRGGGQQTNLHSKGSRPSEFTRPLISVDALWAALSVCWGSLLSELWFAGCCCCCSFSPSSHRESWRLLLSFLALVCHTHSPNKF